MKHNISHIISLFTFLLCISSCSGSSDKYVQFTGFAQGGNYSVKCNIKNVDVEPQAIQQTIDSLLTVVDFTLSGYNKASLLSAYNSGLDVAASLSSTLTSYASTAAGSCEETSPQVKVDEHETTACTHQGSMEMLKDIYAKSYAFYKETEGAFNVAAAPLFDIWGFGFTSDSLPEQKVIDEALLRCEMPAELPEPGAIKLNFNAIAQGYTCDVIADYLHGIGVKDMLVDIGEIYCEGHNPAGKNWAVGVDSPIDGNNDPGKQLRGILDATNEPQGIVTSGNYRKFYVRDGKKYAHTIDPRNGYPVQHNLLSATIIAADATAADAYATYCMVLGFKEAKAFIESRSDLEGYLIYDVNGVMSQWSSPGFNLRPDTITSR